MVSIERLRHILILDDDADYRNLLLKHLTDMFPDVELTEYDPVAEGVPGEKFDWSPYDVMLLDYNLSLHNVTGLEILKIHARNPAFPATIMLTGAGDEDVAIRAMKSGVYDYLRKQSLDKEKLRESVLDTHARHIAALKLKDAVTEARKAASRAAAMAFADYKSRYENLHSEEIKRLQDELHRLRKGLEQSRQVLKKVEEGEIQKNLWKQEQDQMKIEQIEEDLKLFNEGFGTVQKDDDMVLAKEFEKMQKVKHMSEKAERKKKEEDLLSDISNLLDKNDK